MRGGFFLSDAYKKGTIVFTGLWAVVPYTPTELLRVVVKNFSLKNPTFQLEMLESKQENTLEPLQWCLVYHGFIEFSGT